MAPEILKHYQRGTKPQRFEVDQLKKSDVFQLGLILYELSSKIRTSMERNILFGKLRREKAIAGSGSDDCPIM